MNGECTIDAYECEEDCTKCSYYKENCKYCYGDVENRKDIMSDGIDSIYITSNNCLKSMYNDYVMEKINYCPMCGRKLGGD